MSKPQAPNRRRTPGEFCKRCHRDVVVGFNVSGETWEAVVQDRWNVLCPLCFDELAHEALIPYMFEGLWPCPWSCWDGLVESEK